MFGQFDFFTSHGGRIKFLRRWNRILQDLLNLIYLGSFKIITTGQKPLSQNSKKNCFKEKMSKNVEKRRIFNIVLPV